MGAKAVEEVGELCGCAGRAKPVVECTLFPPMSTSQDSLQAVSEGELENINTQVVPDFNPQDGAM